MPDEKMPAETLAALKRSIAHWEMVVADPGRRTGAKDCALCGLFNNVDGRCRGCPVYEATGYSGCRGSPYDEFMDHRTSSNAQAELSFLRSLLPEGERR